MGFLGDLLSGKSRREEERLQLAKDKAVFDQQLRVLQADQKVRPLLDEAYTRFGGDPNDPTNPGNAKQLGATIDDIFKAYSIEAKKNISPDLIKALKDPKFGADVLKYSQDKGLTIGDILQAGDSPLLRAQGRLAIAKHLDTNEAQRAAAAGDQPVSMPAAAQANAAPVPAPSLGSGLQMPGVTAGPAASPTVEAPASPIGAPAAAAPALPATPAPVVAPPKAPTPELQAAVEQIDAQIKNLGKNIATITSKAPDSKSLPLLNDRLKMLTEHRFQLTSKFALEQAGAEAQTGRSIVPPQVLKETGAPAGTLQRDLTAPGAQQRNMLTPEQSAGVAHSATAAGTELTDVLHAGTTARRILPILDVAAEAGKRAGVTGPLVTPVREGLYNVANLFGVNTQKQTALQVMNSLTPQLAIQLTSLMKGQQSDREFLAGVQSTINKNETNQAYAMILSFSKELAQLAIEKEVQARIWTANRDHPGLNLKDAQGHTFQEVFDASVDRINKERGSIGERIARNFGVNYRDVLNGKITPARGAKGGNAP